MVRAMAILPHHAEVSASATARGRERCRGSAHLVAPWMHDSTLRPIAASHRRLSDDHPTIMLNSRSLALICWLSLLWCSSAGCGCGQSAASRARRATRSAAPVAARAWRAPGPCPGSPRRPGPVVVAGWWSVYSRRARCGAAEDAAGGADDAAGACSLAALRARRSTFAHPQRGGCTPAQIVLPAHSSARASMARASGNAASMRPRSLPHSARSLSTRSVAQVRRPMAVRPQHGPQPRRRSCTTSPSPAAWAASGWAQAATATATDSTTTRATRLTMHHLVRWCRVGRRAPLLICGSASPARPAHARAESTTPAAAATRPPRIVSASRFAHDPDHRPHDQQHGGAWSRALSHSVSISASDPVLNRPQNPKPDGLPRAIATPTQTFARVRASSVRVASTVLCIPSDRLFVDAVLPRPRRQLGQHPAPALGQLADGAVDGAHVLGPGFSPAGPARRVAPPRPSARRSGPPGGSASALPQPLELVNDLVVGGWGCWLFVDVEIAHHLFSCALLWGQLARHRLRQRFREEVGTLARFFQSSMALPRPCAGPGPRCAVRGLCPPPRHPFRPGPSATPRTTRTGRPAQAAVICAACAGGHCPESIQRRGAGIDCVSGSRVTRGQIPAIQAIVFPASCAPVRCPTGAEYMDSMVVWPPSRPQPCVQIVSGSVDAERPGTAGDPTGRPADICGEPEPGALVNGLIGSHVLAAATRKRPRRPVPPDRVATGRGCDSRRPRSRAAYVARCRSMGS